MQLFYRSINPLSLCVTLYTHEDVEEIKRKKKEEEEEEKSKKGRGKKKDELEGQEENKNLIKCSLSVAYIRPQPPCVPESNHSSISVVHPVCIPLYNIPLFFRNSRKIVLSARFVSAPRPGARSYENRRGCGFIETLKNSNAP